MNAGLVEVRAKHDGESIEEIRPGYEYLVTFEPCRMHWAGASPTTAITHIAIEDMLDGKAVG